MPRLLHFLHPQGVNDSANQVVLSCLDRRAQGILYEECIAPQERTPTLLYHLFLHVHMTLRVYPWSEIYVPVVVVSREWSSRSALPERDLRERADL